MPKVTGATAPESGAAAGADHGLSDRASGMVPGWGATQFPPVAPAGANGRVTQAEVDALENGLNQTLEALELSLATEVFAERFPLVGTNFWIAWSNQLPAFRYLTTLRTAVVAGLSNLTGQADYTTTAVANAINTRLTSSGFNAGSQVLVTTVGDQAQLAFTTLDTFVANVPIAEDFGLPTLALSRLTETNCRTAVSVTFNFTAGVDGGGFYLETPGTFTFNTTSTISNLNTSARFARLPYTLTDVTTNRTSVPLNFNIRIQDPNFSGQLRLNELGGSPDLIDANVTGNTRMSFALLSSLPPSALMPQVGSNFELLWNFVDASVNPNDDNATFGNKPNWNLRYNRINLHSFFNAFARKALDEIEDTTEPLAPLIDILTTEIPLMSDLGSEAVTVLDVLGYDPESVAAIGGLLALADLADLAGSYQDNQNVFVDMGDYSLQVGDPRVEHLDDIPGSLSRGPAATLDADLVDFKADAAGISGLSFPILDDGNVTAKILLGRTGTLFAWNSGAFEIEEQFSQYFPVLGPVGVTLGGRVALKTQFGFGYDTQGIFDFYDAGSSDPDLLLNGFFALAEDDQGNPVTGITLEAGVTAGIEANIVIASAGVEGDVTATIGMYLDGNLGLGDGRVRGYTLANTPFDEWFYAAGSLSAGLRAYLEVGWPPFGYSFEFDSPRVTLISFDSQDEIVPILASPDPGNPTRLLLNVGERAPLRVFGDIDDRAEEYQMGVQTDFFGGIELWVSAFNETNVFAPPAQIVGHAKERGDVLSLAANVNIPVVFTGGPGRDELIGGAGNDELDGGEGPDRLIGNGGDDELRGGADNDELRGGAGNNILNGGEGLDTASWRGAAIPVIIDLRIPAFGGAAANDTLISIERYEGSDWPDLIDGSEGLDHLLAGAGGDDIINGHGGPDMIEGGGGDDTLNGGAGDDLIIGGSGADTLDGGDGMDTVSYLGAYSPVTVSLLTGTGTRGDANGDTLVNFEMLIGTALPKEDGGVFSSGDVLEGSDNADTIYGMDGADTIRGAGGNDLIYGNHPDSPESMRAGYDADNIQGGAGNDTIYGQGDDDTLDGGAGMDTVYGENGNDHLITFDLLNADVLDGGPGTNRLSADYSDKNVPLIFIVGTNNSFTFPDGDQFLNFHTLGTFTAGNSNDVIRLADRQEHAYWNKTIDGAGGDDRIIADWRGFYSLPGGPVRTTDALHGGAGNDTISFEQSIGGVNVNLGSGGLGGAATGMTMSGFENIIGTEHIDTLTGDTNDNYFYPLRGYPGTPQQGGAGFDRIYGGDGADTVVIDYSQLPEAHVLGLRMDANYCSCDEVIRLGPGGQPLHAYRYVEAFHITGSQTNDVLFGEGIATTGQTADMFNDRFIGLGGNDYIESRFGHDYVDGGEGDDTLEVGTGNDTAIGGPGHDTINFEFGSAYGTDFVDAGAGDDMVTNLRDPTPSSVPGINAEAGAIFRADGGPGYDTLNADFSNQSAPIHFNQASPTDIEFPNGAYIRGFEYWRYFVAGNGNDVIVFTGRQNNRIQMHGGDDIINPGLGIDIVSGGLGNDLLIIDYSVGDDANLGGLISVSSSVYERRDLGTGTAVDRVTVTTGGNAAYTVERHHVTGTSKADDFQGSNGPDILLGGPGNDIIDGWPGNDYVDGGPGADSMHGHSGNDLLIVDDPGDVVTENSGQGTDTVRSSVNYTLPANVELLVLTGGATNGTGNSASNLITGNSLNNYLRGEGGNDRLDGSGGPGEIDRLNGGPGADTFVLGDAGARFYDDGNPANPGHNGYAIVEDYTPSQSDRLRLAGGPGEYFLGASPIGGVPGSAIYHDSNGNNVFDPATDELIAILASGEALTTANTLANASYTQFVDPAMIGLTAPLLPFLLNDGSGLRFALEFSILEPMPEGALLEIQASSDLGFTDPWLTIASKSGSGGWTGLATVTTTAPDNGRVSVTVRGLQPVAQRAQQFFRAKISQP